MLDFALAYIDPGSGSLIIQVIIASILAVPFFLRTQIARVIGSLRGRDKPVAAEPLPASAPLSPDDTSPPAAG